MTFWGSEGGSEAKRRRGEAEAEARRGDGGSPRRRPRGRAGGGARARRRPRAAGISVAFIGLANELLQLEMISIRNDFN